MIEKRLDKLFSDIKKDCVELIQEKDVSISDLSFQLGISADEFVQRFQSRCRDFSFYLKTYDILMKW